MAAPKFGVDARTPLLNPQTRSHASLDSETVKALSGRASWLYQFATGAEAGGTDQQPLVPLTPSGRVGHDHSGPPYGSALQHPLWTIGGVQTISALTRDDGTNYYDSTIAFSIAATNNTIEPVLCARFYCRPFPEYENSPYSRAYLSVAALSASGTQTLKADLWAGDDPDSVQSATTSITDTSWPPQFWNPSTIYWNVKPGWNVHYVRFRCTTTSGVAIYSASANQIVKRSH